MSQQLLHDHVDVIDIDELIPYANNPKEHPDAQIKKIASSIKNYGWDQPIVIDADNEIIKGHGRLMAAERLGLERVPVIRRDDLSDAQARAARIADNKTAESEWDDELLGIELEQLLDEPIDLDSLGFDDDELEDMLMMIDPPDLGSNAYLDDDIHHGDGVRVVVIAESEAEAGIIGEWADEHAFEWHVIDE